MKPVEVFAHAFVRVADCVVGQSYFVDDEGGTSATEMKCVAKNADGGTFKGSGQRRDLALDARVTAIAGVKLK